MPDISANGSAQSHSVGPWLLPLSDTQVCGPDLEYDPEFLALAEAGGGKPASQFGPGSPPDWVQVRDVSESLFKRTRDLRVASWWARAKLNLEGFAGLPAALTLLHGLLENFWSDLHPQPADDPDALARLSVIGGLDKLDNLLGDIRNAELSSDRRLGGLRVRDVEVALSKLAPRAGEAPRAVSEVAGLIAQAADLGAALRAQTDAALGSLDQIGTLMSQRFSAHLVVDLARARGMLTGLQSVLPARATTDDMPMESNDASGSTDPLQPAGQVGAGVHSVNTRQDAIRAIELVCAYLERHEPTNPAQLLLRRAARVIDKSFLQLVQELAPDAVKDVARIMGVDPSSVKDQN